MARRRGGNDKFLRLTGLWQSKKKDTLFSGKLRNQDIEGLINKLNEALDNDADMVFFLWENEKEGHKDPDFTLQTAVADSDGGGRGRNRRDRDDDRDEDKGRRSKRSRDDEDEEETEEEEEEEQEEKPRGKGKSSGKSKGKKEEDW